MYDSGQWHIQQAAFTKEEVDLNLSEFPVPNPNGQKFSTVDCGRRYPGTLQMTRDPDANAGTNCWACELCILGHKLDRLAPDSIGVFLSFEACKIASPPTDNIEALKGDQHHD
ncbi:MAG: hypothetical protein M1818_004284 [Claussenomyces sp. TS43310]|nr:MAG: hypothetical protein M1818_004284 [Claussenomyces sp. TS43310]